MKGKKILFLGGAHSQVPAIKYAKSIGLKVITADYLPSNPGHKISDEYYNISTIDKEKILGLSKELKIDAITAYASDPAAPTAAYVSEQMGLDGSSYKSVLTLFDKILFRTFLQQHSFRTPWYIGSGSLEDLINKYPGGKAVLKPVDSSGSKGVMIVNNEVDIIKLFPLAMQYSKSKHVIVEEFIERKGPQIHGEGFVYDGELVFILMGDQVFSPVNNLIPYSTIVPSIFHSDIMNDLIEKVEVAIKKVGFKTGGVNIEIIRDADDNIYILEIGARNGGNFMPQLMYHATGFDLVKANVDSLINASFQPQIYRQPQKHFAQIILHSNKNGCFSGINIPHELRNCIIERNLYYKVGEAIHQYKSSGDVIGVLIIEAEKKIKDYYQSISDNNWVKVS